MSDEPTKVFISYSHDSDEHKKWVLDLATDLVTNGVDTILDQWDLGLGGDLPKFMEGISASDRVLAICTDNYIEKSNKGIGGVGYEKMILTAELFKVQDTNKFIPIVRNISGKDKTPICLSSKTYIDFSDEANYENKLEELLRDIHEESLVVKPPLGKNPFKNDVSQQTRQSFRADIGKSQIQLSDSARHLLKEASLDSNGVILYLRTFSDTIIQTNSKNFITSNNPREIAKWKSALDELVNEELLVAPPIGSIGNAYKLTNLGYEIADNIRTE